MLSIFTFRARGLRCLLGVLLVALCAGDIAIRAADLVAVPALGLRVSRGFRVTLFADSGLANDIYALTFDSRGNVVVTSQGYVRTLFDRDGDGVADEAVDLAQTQTGGMGLCFDGNDLMFVGDGALWRFQDANGDGTFDGAPQRLLSLQFYEHGGHAVRKGPDGWWYVVAGNETRFTNEHNSLASSPIRKIEGGALLRFPPDGRGVEAIAHGFRNPYDFDFTSAGDLFTCDSDCEGDFFLPWYTPTRLYHIAPGGHHGWRLEGWTRSWARPAYSPDTVDIMVPIGRGSPTGVTCYRHNSFPDYYRDGLFYLDWTFGRVYFTPLQADGSTYRANPDVFLEPIGTHGFAPTDAAIAPDGSLFISIGGRKTRGAVYRIQYVAEPQRQLLATNWATIVTTEADAVLQAPQPLDAWSRAYWVPLAARIGPDLFEDRASDNRIAAETRVRAIEVLTEVHGGLPTAVANTCAQAVAPVVRARTAWSLGRVPCQNFGPILLGLARDVSPYVRCHALEAIRAHAGEFDNVFLQQALAANLVHTDKRVRQAAALLATRLPEPAWKALWNQQKTAAWQARLTTTLAWLWRDPPASPDTNAIESALSVLAQSPLVDHRLQAIRLVILALGDYHLHSPSVEVFTAYEPALALDGIKPLTARIRKAVTGIFPSGNPTLDFEAARLLAMVEADDPKLPGKILALCASGSSASADFHYLTVLARLKSPLPTNSTAKLANAILLLDRKLEGQEQRTKQNWTTRLTEVITALQQRHPPLADALLRHPDFARPGHLELVPSLGSTRFLACARRFLDVVKHDSSFPWSGALIDLLSALPSEETVTLLRQQWSNVALRDRLLIELANNPSPADRDKFVTGLSSTQTETVRAAMSALLRLPREQSTRTYAPALRTLRGLLDQPKEQTMRAQVVTFLSYEAGQPFKVQDTGSDLRRAYQPIFDWFNVKHPALIRQLDADDAEDPAKWNLFYKSVQWDKGDARRGETLFTERGCLTCHAGNSPLGPDLGGVAGRFSATDLFNAIIFPSRDVAELYRMTTFHTRDGQVITGMVAFESADGVILRTGAASTLRLAENDIISREPSSLSLMPSGLLAGLPPTGFADLCAYLKTLQPRK
jgi:putative membrane-bound dehydrogenase-like protein